MGQRPRRRLDNTPFRTQPRLVRDTMPEQREIRAHFNDTTITVYQAYNAEIADNAIKAGTLVAPFKMDRMTGIKPSFLWMMYRCGWATKLGQERVLAIDITREGFEWALANAALSSFSSLIHPDKESWREHMNDAPVRVQWDPERDLLLNVLPFRSIQVGLRGVAVRKYVTEWIRDVRDLTSQMQSMKRSLELDRTEEARRMLPREAILSIASSYR